MFVMFLSLGIALMLAIFTVPMKCCSPISKPPIRGCRTHVYGLIGRCRHHGRHPVLRLMATLGGLHLPERRVCDMCGRPALFCRMQKNGKPFLGCSGYPNCKNPRWLNNYNF
jgi:hypothetical protein